MKELRRIEKELDKTLNDLHSVKLKDGTSGMVIDWEVRIAIVTSHEGKVFSTIDKIAKVVRKI